MRIASLVSVALLGLGTLGRSGNAHGQEGAKAKVCGLLPTAELEAHFKAKAGSVRGSDTPTISMCSADLPDSRHGAQVMSQPPGPVAVTVEQRLAAIRSTLERNGSHIEILGQVGCFSDKIELVGPKLPTTTCFLQRGGYLSLTLRSDDASRLDFKAVKQLLEKAAARRW